MKMITNYLNSLESYLPDEMKREVREELEASIYGEIEDRQASLKRELNEQEQELLLKNVGHPMKVAASYLPNQQLISADYFPAYKKALEIALKIMLVITLLVTVFHIFISEQVFISLIRLFGELIDTAVWVFAIVTIVFYLMQKNTTSLEQLYAWSAKDIKALKPKLSINRLEIFFEIGIAVLFLAWWFDWISIPATLREDGIAATVSLSAEWLLVNWSVILITGLGIALGFYKLIIGGWNKLSLISNILLSLIVLVVLYQITQFDQLITINIDGNNLQQLAKAFAVMENLIYFALFLIAADMIWEIYSNIQKFLNR